MPQLGFNKQFVPKVEDGRKPHTIRVKRKRPIYAGDTLYLAEGMRTKNYRLIMKVQCTKVQEIEIMRLVEVGVVIFVDGHCLSKPETMALIERDGFETKEAFIEWFLPNNTDRFEGDLIWWR